MTFDEYQQQAASFRLKSADEIYAYLGLIGELGEVYSHLAKAIRDGNAIDPAYMKKELGDVLWFVSALADDIHLSFNELAQANIAKLADRQARGVIQGSGDNR